jgi:hypothetical protein
VSSAAVVLPSESCRHVVPFLTELPSSISHIPPSALLGELVLRSSVVAPHPRHFPRAGSHRHCEEVEFHRFNRRCRDASPLPPATFFFAAVHLMSPQHRCRSRTFGSSPPSCSLSGTDTCTCIDIWRIWIRKYDIL